MKKNLIAFAAATLCAAGAYAQSSVQLTGIVDLYAGSKQYAGTQKTTRVDSGGLTTSWWGLKGTEDLGGGLKASFQLTSFFQADSGVQGRFTGDTFFSRDANVSLSGGFGSVLLGRWMAPNFLPSVVGNPIGDSFTFSPLILHKDVPVFGASGPIIPTMTPSDTGWSNQVVYSTPDIGGFKANLQYQFGEQAGNTGKNNVGANFFYFGGPLTLTGFYENADVGNPGGALLANNHKYWMLLGAYDLGMIKPYLSYGEKKIDDTTNTKGKTYQIGASAPLGQGKVLVEWVKTEWSFNTERKTFALGYDYNLSKRTDVYAMYLNDKYTGLNNGNSLGVGVRHRF
ncbi:MAG: porin [Comamonadaceae bacterium]|nr:MAG: porin [Comamonadaceae bacterium]